ETMLCLSVVLVLLLGVRDVLFGHMELVCYVAFLTYMVQLTWPVIALGWVVNLFQRGTASMARINEILVEQPEIADEETVGKHAHTTHLEGEIEVRGLNVAYNGKQVLHDINLRIPAGSS